MDVRSSTPLNAANTANPVSQHFDELRREMDSFLVTFNHWIDERRRTLTDEKEICARTVQEERDTVEALKRQHQQLLGKKQNIVNAIEEEQREFREVVQANQEFSQQTVQLQRRIDELKQEFQECQSEVDREAKQLGLRERSRDLSVSGNKAIIGLFEDVMGVFIEPVSTDCIRLVFTKIDPQQPNHPFSLTIDHSGDRYSVSECAPAIPDMPSLVAALNQTHDFCQFVCRTRRRFADIAGLK